MTLGVTFDLDGTLATLEPPWPQIAADALGVTADADAVQTFGRTLRDGLEATRKDSIEHAATVTARNHTLSREPANIAQSFRDREVEATVASPGAGSVVRSISKHCPTGIVTNGDEALQRRKAAGVGVSEYVDAIVVSSEVGIRKPERGIFDAAADRLGADRYLHIGDDRIEDVSGALAAGWEAVHLDTSTDPEKPVGTITDLSRLADLV